MNKFNSACRVYSAPEEFGCLFLPAGPGKKTGLSAPSPRKRRCASCGLSAPIPDAVAAQNQAPELPSQFRGQVIASGNYLRITRRSQFLDKIAWFATKREAQRSARLYHQPAATTTITINRHACRFVTNRLPGGNPASVDACV
jgi:hypothetical protein